jgi:exosortase/archaeosortase family protein
MRRTDRKRMMEALRFLVKFNLLAIPMYLLMYANVTFPQAQSVVAESVHSLLGVFGYETVVNGHTVVFSSGLTIVNAEMTFDCIGWKSMYMLFALIAATPRVGWMKKAKFLLAGLPAIFVINIIRIATTIAAVTSMGAGYLDVVHSVLWQEGLVIAVVGIWYLWLRKEKVISIKIEK